MRSVNYKLYWIRLVDKDGRLVVRDNFDKVCDTERHLLMFINQYKSEHERLYSMVLTDEPFYQQIAKEDVILDVVGYVSIFTGIRRDHILSGIKDREVADARKIISGICTEMGLQPSQIHKMTGFDRSGIYAQISSSKKLRTTDKKWAKRYDAISQKIIKDLTNESKDN